MSYSFLPFLPCASSALKLPFIQKSKRDKTYLRASFVANLTFQVFLALVKERGTTDKCFPALTTLLQQFLLLWATVLLYPGVAILLHPLSFQIFINWGGLGHWRGGKSYTNTLQFNLICMYFFACISAVA